MRTTMATLVALVVLVFLQSIVVDACAGTLYGVDFDATALLTIDTTTASTTTVGISSPQYTGLALNTNTGTLFGRSFGELYVLNQNNGAASLVGNNGVAVNMRSLAFSSDLSTLYSLSWDSGSTSLYSVNTLNGNATLIGSHSIPFVGALAINSLNDAVVADTLSDNDKLYSLNLSTGAVTPIATIADGLVSMTFDEDDNLFGITLSPDNLVQINTTTGAFTTIGTVPFVDVTGLTVAAAVPEPSTFTLAAFAMLGLAYARRKW